MQKKHHPEDLIRMLYDRTVGKGMLLGGEEKAPEPVEIVFRVVDDTNSP